MLKSKIHRATVTHADVDYEGSLTIPPELMTAADIWPNEQVHVWNVTRGSRLDTYAIRGEPNTSTLCANGAAAHHIRPGDLIIITTYTMLDDVQAQTHQPRVIFVDENNQVREVTEVEVAGPQRR